MLYRVRCRFWLSQKQATDEHMIRFRFEDREVELRSFRKDKPIRDSNWVYLECGGIPGLEVAGEFGQRLRRAFELAGVLRSVGVNTGTEVAELPPDARRRRGIHGVDVYEDHDDVRITTAFASAEVLRRPNELLEFASTLNLNALLQPTSDAIDLYRAALLANDGMARATLMFASVEMLAGEAEWSVEQRKVIDAAVETAKQDTTLSSSDRDEVVKAIDRIYRQGVMKGLRRLLNRLRLKKMQDDFKELYEQRSAIFHGLEAGKGIDHREFSDRAELLCGEIILQALKSDGVYGVRPNQK